MTNNVASINPEFHAEHRRLLSRFEILLGKKLTGAGEKGPLRESLEHAHYLFYKRRLDECSVELSRLGLFLEELEMIKAHNAQMFSKLIKPLRNQSGAQYYGARMELEIAYKLIHDRVRFRSREAPDFSISWVNEEVYIECTSAHMEKKPDCDLTYKISNAISGKGNKPYANARTVVSLDVTNLMHHHQQPGEATFNDWEKAVQPALEATPLGGVLVFFFMYEPASARIGSVYRRFDHPMIDPLLRSFLDTWFPFGKLKARSVFPEAP
jgi:hypothetical protein